MVSSLQLDFLAPPALVASVDSGVCSLAVFQRVCGVSALKGVVNGTLSWAAFVVAWKVVMQIAHLAPFVLADSFFFCLSWVVGFAPFFAFAAPIVRLSYEGLVHAAMHCRRSSEQALASMPGS